MSIFLKQYFLLLVIVFFLHSCTTVGAIKLLNSGEVVPSNNTKSVIPFELKKHPIFIKCRLNNSLKKYTFILDTGALTFVSLQVAKELKLRNVMKIQAHGSAGKTEAINLVQLKSVVVGNAQVADITAAVFDFSEKIGANIDGILGSNFLKFFQVTIDYQKNEILFVQDAHPTFAKNGAIQIAFETNMENSFAPIIECMINDDIKSAAIIDTGTYELAGLPLSLMKRMDHFLDGNVLTAEGGMRNGLFGTADESYLLRLNSLKIGSLTLSNIPTMSHSLKNEHILLGNKFLSKFVVTIDYPASIIVLHPYTNFFETNIFSFGLNLVKRNNKTIVSGVWDKSPASKLGIEPGDEIVKIDSKNTELLSLFELMTLLMDDSINSIDIEFIHKNRNHKGNLQKEMLLPILEWAGA